MSLQGCPHGPVEITGGPNTCPDCLKGQDDARESLEDGQRELEHLEHEEHVARRLADGWYAVHFCQECREEWNREGVRQKPQF